MSQDIDQELSCLLNNANLLPSNPITKKCTRSQGIESNPLYKTYEATDLSLWQKSEGRVKKKTTPKRTLIRKPILQQLKNKTNLKAKDWLQSNLTEVKEISTWTQRTPADKTTLKPRYSMNDMLNECDNVMSEIDELPSCSTNQVSELISYFDDIVHIPKKMSEMAESMYS